ncbi:MAG: hypothetical protein KME42_14145 [Tildeniella nuda ZEHNDER 1965/U140]|nr:hypothetical protein [Tildeniella nuda ZEHNDER 1965/U140]
MNKLTKADIAKITPVHKALVNNLVFCLAPGDLVLKHDGLTAIVYMPSCNTVMQWEAEEVSGGEDKCLSWRVAGNYQPD